MKPSQTILRKYLQLRRDIIEILSTMGSENWDNKGTKIRYFADVLLNRFGGYEKFKQMEKMQ